MNMNTNMNINMNMNTNMNTNMNRTNGGISNTMEQLNYERERNNNQQQHCVNE